MGKIATRHAPCCLRTLCGRGERQQSSAEGDGAMGTKGDIGHQQVDPGGPGAPPAPQDCFKIMQFSGIFFKSKFWAQGPLWGQKSTGAPPDQNPCSASVTCAWLVRKASNVSHRCHLCPSSGLVSHVGQKKRKERKKNENKTKQKKNKKRKMKR